MVCWRRLPPSSRPSPFPLPSLLLASLPSPVDGGRKAPGALSPLTTYGMTSEWENVPRPRGSSHSPHWNQIHIWSRGSGPGARGVVPALQRGDRKERLERGKKAREKKSKVAACSVCLIVSLSRCLSVSGCPPSALAFSPLRSPSLHHPPGRSTHAPHSSLHASGSKRRGCCPKARTPDSERRTQASPRGPHGSRSRCRARRSSQGHSRAQGAAKVCTGGGGKGRLWRRELREGKTPSTPRADFSTSHGKSRELPRRGDGVSPPSPFFPLQIQGIARCWMPGFDSIHQASC